MMGFYYLAPLIVFLIWYALHRFSDDASAIESFQSSEDLKDEVEKEGTVKKSEFLWRYSVEVVIEGCQWILLMVYRKIDSSHNVNNSVLRNFYRKINLEFM